MIVFLSNAYNFLPLVTSAKASLTAKTVDPFLRLEDDCKLRALDNKIEADNVLNVYGSKEDDVDALKSLSAIKISDDQSTESFASMIMENSGKISNSELSSTKEQLLKDFLPDDVCPLGAQLVIETPDQIYRSGSKVEHSIFTTSDDFPTDSFGSQSTLECPSLLSFNQLLDMVSETTKEVVARFSVSTPSDLPFKDMASNCEALQMGKQQVMSNFMPLSPQFIHHTPRSFCFQDSVQPQNLVSFEPGDFMTSPITGVSMPCAAEYQHHPNFSALPTASPYDNFLKAAGS